MSTSSVRRGARVLPADPKPIGIVIGALIVLFWALEILDTLLPIDLDSFGIIPRAVAGLDGIVFAPLPHVGFGHLVANTLPVIVLGFLAAAGGLRQWLAVTGVIWVVGGVAVWLFARTAVHLGASLLVFGWLGFLLARGFFARSAKQMLLAAIVLALYGGALLGVFPIDAGVSWEAHLFGLLAGILAAALTASADREAATA